VRDLQSVYADALQTPRSSLGWFGTMNAYRPLLKLFPFTR
jgi:hypothetical protein